MTDQPDISVTCEVGEAFADLLEARLNEVHRLVPIAPPTLSVAIVDDDHMSRLHEQFLGISGPTDVLTFEFACGADGQVVEGEIVICLDEARRQAEDRGHDLADELLLYAVHGLLHLSGYDDLTAAGHQRMHAEEDRLLQAIGVGTIYARPARPESGCGPSEVDVE